MRKTTIAIFISLISLGLVCFIFFLFSINFNFNNLINIESREQIIEEEFTFIKIEHDTAEIKILPSADKTTKLYFREKSRTPFTASVVDNTLSVGFTDDSKWYHNLFNFGNTYMELYLPQETYQSLTINNSTGDIFIKDFISAGDIDITVSTADVDVINVNCANVNIKHSTGDVEIEKLVANGDLTITGSTGDLNVENSKVNNAKIELSTGDIDLDDFILLSSLDIIVSTGDVEINNCDCGSAKIKTSTGDVKGNFLSPKIIYASANTGKVIVPNSDNGGVCEITTSTGDIIITDREIDD